MASQSLCLGSQAIVNGKVRETTTTLYSILYGELRESQRTYSPVLPRRHAQRVPAAAGDGHRSALPRRLAGKDGWRHTRERAFKSSRRIEGMFEARGDKLDQRFPEANDFRHST